MIFIFTHKQDFTADFVIDKLNQRNIEYYRFNCEDIDNKEYSILLGNKNEIQIHQNKSIDSIWFRRTKLPSISNQDKVEELFLLSEYDSLLSNFYHLLEPKKWLSFPPNVYLAENKLYQLNVAQKVGFKIPNTIVSNDSENIKKFSKKYGNSIIIKQLGHGRLTLKDGIKNIYTNKIDKQVIENLDNFLLTPAIIQENIEKNYEIRVTVVEKKIFSAKIDSQKNDNSKIDWRREISKFDTYILPKEIEDKCIKLVSRLGLSFGAIDLIKNLKNEYIFLEINPNGQWAWIENDTNLPISDEIINFLTK